MKSFTFRVGNDHELILLDKAIAKLAEHGIRYTASYTSNDANQDVITLTTVPFTS